MEANIAYYCLHRLHKWPHEFLELDVQERAMIVACIETKRKADKKAGNSIKKAGRRK